MMNSQEKEECVMSDKLCQETRQVVDFEQVVLRIENWLSDLEIIQGERESLTIEASSHLLPKIETTVSNGKLVIRLAAGFWEKLGYALATSLTRPRVRFRLEVTSLTDLTVVGTARVSAPKLESDRLALSLAGAGEIQIRQLAAKHLSVDLGGAGRIELAGQVVEQEVSTAGAGHYDASDLESKKATVQLRGMGWANVWVIEDLATDICGAGRVEYRGKPKVRRTVAAGWPMPACP